MTCRICSNADGNVAYKVREMNLGFREWFSYFQCSRCGCLQIRAFPPDIGKYYPPTYYSFGAPEPAVSRPVSRIRALTRGIRDRYAIVGRGIAGRILHGFWPNPGLEEQAAAWFPGEGAKEAGLTRRSRILDVGSGAGKILVQLQAAGFSRLLGIDAFVESDLEYPGGLRILKRTIHEVSGRWDLIMFHHSFEHMADPEQALDAAANLLSPNGTCLIRLPLVSSYAWEHYGVDWVQLDAPRHFFLHSIESLGRLARHAGLSISKIVYDSGPFQFLGSELYRRDIPLHSTAPADVEARAAAFTASELSEFDRQARALNAAGRGDQAAFYLRRVR